MFRIFTLFLLTSLLLLHVDVNGQLQCGSQQITYTHETDNQLLTNILNPARGLYLDSVTSVSYFHPLEKDHLRCLTDNHGTNLLLRMYSLDSFTDGSPISQDFLKKLEQDLEAAKDAGWSLVLRFMYINSLDSQYNPQSEPTITQIQNHIRQLAPILNKYNGVVVAVQAGFHGEYGLWYTPGTNSTQQDTTIISTLLQNLQMPIQVAHPAYKLKSSPMVDRSQIGHYHECLLGGDANNIISAFPDLSKDQGAFTTMKIDTALIGGKTCHPGDTTNPPRNLCPQSEQLFNDLHLTYLNGLEPDETVKNYDKYGCLEKIFNTLGYRLALESVSLPTMASTTGQACIAVNISNRGYAAPIRHYNVSFVLQNTVDRSKIYEAPVRSDTAKWFPGNEAKVSATFDLPSSIPVGKYEVFLKISEPKFENNTDYNVLLSNSNPKYSVTNGLNKLGYTQIASNGNPGNHVTTTSSLKPWQLPTVTSNPRKWQKNTRSCLQLPNGPPSSNTGNTASSTPSTSVTASPVTSMTTTILPLPFVPFINNTDNIEKCRKLDTVRALLQFTYITNTSLPDCPNSSSRASPEAIPVNFCNAPTNTIQWRPKGRVIDNCEKIPMYARVAVFSSLNYYDYDTAVRKCGVFLGCLKDGSKITGVKIGMQLCGRPFDIENAKFSNEKNLLNLYVF